MRASECHVGTLKRILPAALPLHPRGSRTAARAISALMRRACYHRRRASRWSWWLDSSAEFAAAVLVISCHGHGQWLGSSSAHSHHLQKQESGWTVPTSCKEEALRRSFSVSLRVFPNCSAISGCPFQRVYLHAAAQLASGTRQGHFCASLRCTQHMYDRSPTSYRCRGGVWGRSQGQTVERWDRGSILRKFLR